jgi:putative SOS response-associated peptidase YedK
MLGHRGNEVDARSVHGMCGRFTSTVAPADLAAYFEVDELATDDLGPRWNVAPTDSVYAVAESASSGRRRLGTFRWGLVPFFAKDASGGARMINARAETLLDKPAFAGLWSVWRPTPGSDEGRLVTCTIVTGPPNDLVRRVHDRMPVVLPPSTWDAWLDPGNDDVDALRRLLVPAPADLFTAVAVSDAVSNVRNDGPHLLEPAP